MSTQVEIVEVAARDGLQNESTLLNTATKVDLINRAVAAGTRRIETTSFVHPKLVPAMADAEAVMAALPDRPDVTYVGLVLNDRGLERAVAAGCDEVNVVVPVTDGFASVNQNTTVADAITMWHRLAEHATDAGVAASVVLSVAFGCPYDGEVQIADLVSVVEECVATSPARLTLGDTIGVATPGDVTERLTAIGEVLPSQPIACHFHNTRNTGYANAYAALLAGCRSFDASLGGIGGCPFAPNATGNIATEDLVYQLHRMGYDTGLDLDALAEGARWLSGHLPDSIAGLYAKAGPFPT